MSTPVATERTLEELLDLAYKDELTGLYNRRHLNDELAQQLSEASPDDTYAFLLIDIDFFKDINDTHGHSSGDLVLQSVARMLESMCQDGDVPIRFSGDEFVVLLADLDFARARVRAEEILVACREREVPLEGKQTPVQFTLSIGVASYPQHGDSWRQVLDRADQALYRAKNAGRDRVALPPAADAELIRGDDLSRFFPCSEFIGREQTVADLHDCYAEWRDGLSETPTPIVLCTGAQGLGKSRLLREFGSLGQADGATVLRLTGSVELQSVRHACFVQALINHVGSAAELRELLQLNLPPEDHPVCDTYFGSKTEEAASVSDQDAERMFARALQVISSGTLCVIIVDDVEVVDEATQSFLRALQTSSTVEQRFFIVVGSQGQNQAQTDLVVESFGSEANSGGSCLLLEDCDLSTITLEPLDAADTKRMVATILPTLRLDEAYLQQLHQLSQGNLMYIEEALKYLIQIRRLVFERSAWHLQNARLDDLPQQIDELVTKRFEACDPELRSLLAKASVMDGGIRPDLLAKMEDSDAGYTLDLLDRARRMGILEGRRLWEDDAFCFYSDTAKTVTHDQISEDDKAAWHGQFAEMLESIPDLPALLQMGTVLHHSEIGKLEQKTADARDLLDQIAGASKRGGDSPQPPAPRPPSEKLAAKQQRLNKKAKWPEPEPLSADEFATTVAVFSSSRAAVQQTRLYPRTSDVVQAAYGKVHACLEKLFESAATVDFSEADGDLLVNGELPIWKPDEAALANNYCSMMTQVGLNSVSFARGITRDEIEILMNTWIDTLNRERDFEEAWDEFADRSDVEHIDLNARVYVAFRDGELQGGGVGGFAVETARVLESKQALEDVIDLLRTWTSSVSPEIAKQLSSEERAHIGDLLCKLREVVLPEDATTGPEPTASFDDLLAGVDAAEAEERSENGGNDAEDDPSDAEEKPDAIAPGLQLEAALEAVQSNGSVGILTDNVTGGDVAEYLSDLLSGDPQREKRGRDLLAAMGEQAIESLYTFVTRTSDVRAAKLAAEYLGKLANDLDDRIINDLQRKAEATLKRRLLRFAVPVIKDDQRKQQVLIEATIQEKTPVAVEAVDRLASEYPEFAAGILLDIMPACNEAVQSEICAKLGRLRDPACIDPLLNIVAGWSKVVDDEPSLTVVENACHGLGYFDSPPVIELLESLIEPPSRMAWKKTPPARIRNAALAALVMIGGDQVRAILSPYAKDKNSRFRLRVRKFLRNETGAATASTDEQNSAHDEDTDSASAADEATDSD